jgi:hypothetical protein
MLNDELLLDAVALVNSKKEELAQLQSDVESASGCGMCGFGSN